MIIKTIKITDIRVPSWQTHESKVADISGQGGTTETDSRTRLSDSYVPNQGLRHKVT